MAGKAPQIHSMSTDETRNISIDMTDMLEHGETLTGTPQIQSSADFVADNKQVNASAVVINGRTVPIGKVIQFSAQCDAPGRYTVEALCQTSAGQTVEGSITVRVERSRY